MPNRTIPKLNVKCDHKGEGMYYCKDCKPTLKQMGEWLAAIHKKYDELKEQMDERDRRDADGVR